VGSLGAEDGPRPGTCLDAVEDSVLGGGSDAVQVGELPALDAVRVEVVADGKNAVRFGVVE
jgi:hypothetical protein